VSHAQRRGRLAIQLKIISVKAAFGAACTGPTPSLAGAEDKLAQIDRRAGRTGTVDLGIPAAAGPQQKASTRHDD
jgi:hypothetical protein